MWERTRTLGRRAQEVRDTNILERGIGQSPSRNRFGGEEPSSSFTKKSKLKIPLLENWGEEETLEAIDNIPNTTPLPSPTISNHHHHLNHPTKWC